MHPVGYIFLSCLCFALSAHRFLTCVSSRLYFPHQNSVGQFPCKQVQLKGDGFLVVVIILVLHTRREAQRRRPTPHRQVSRCLFHRSIYDEERQGGGRVRVVELILKERLFLTMNL